jgi:hypothetical protein
MRFMMLMIPKGYEPAAPGTMPPADAVGVQVPGRPERGDRNPASAGNGRFS